MHFCLFNVRMEWNGAPSPEQKEKKQKQKKKQTNSVELKRDHSNMKNLALGPFVCIRNNWLSWTLLCTRSNK